MELRKVINGSDAGTIGTFARIGWHQPPVRAVPAIGIFTYACFWRFCRCFPGFSLKNRSTFFTPHKLEILLNKYSKKSAHLQEKCAENVDFIKKKPV